MEASGFRVASYGSGDEILSHLPGSEPGCILLDLQMPGLNGLELQNLLAEKVPLLPIVFLTGHADIPSTVQAMKAGAADFLEKPVSGKALLEAIKQALLRYESRRSARDRTQVFQALVMRLTPRETDVLRLLVRGKRNKEIAYALGVSDRTVKAHRRRLMEKLEVSTLAEVVSIAERVGLLHSGAEVSPLSKSPEVAPRGMVNFVSHNGVVLPDPLHGQGWRRRLRHRAAAN